MKKCITRRGKSTFLLNGRKVSAANANRARKLAIPPAYTNVCVSTNPKSDLQATAVDAKGTTHRYYSKAALEKRRRHRRDRAHLIRPEKIMARTAAILRRRDHPDFETARMLRLMARFYLRTGGRSDSTAYGALTLQKKHMRLGGGGSVRLKFKAKYGRERFMEVSDPVLAKSFRNLKHTRLAKGTSRAKMVALLRKIHNRDDLKLKDLRTSAAIRLLNEQHDMGKEKKEALAAVAEMLGHTTSVCKKYYTL